MVGTSARVTTTVTHATCLVERTSDVCCVKTLPICTKMSVSLSVLRDSSQKGRATSVVSVSPHHHAYVGVRFLPEIWCKVLCPVRPRGWSDPLPSLARESSLWQSLSFGGTRGALVSALQMSKSLPMPTPKTMTQAAFTKKKPHSSLHRDSNKRSKACDVAVVPPPPDNLMLPIFTEIIRLMLLDVLICTIFVLLCFPCVPSSTRVFQHDTNSPTVVLAFGSAGARLRHHRRNSLCGSVSYCSSTQQGCFQYISKHFCALPIGSRHSCRVYDLRLISGPLYYGSSLHAPHCHTHSKSYITPT
eukprot:m.124524 g.124524  ORF g.124524 m.124524 type:complete len:302 (+) comp17296_c0_seq1:465-1370(+)